MARFKKLDLVIICQKHGVATCPECDDPPMPPDEVHINRAYDVPYTGGYSIDGSTIYIDRKLPRKFHTTLGQNVRSDKYLILHEVTEKSLMQHLGLTYNEAHRLSVGVEEKALSCDGVPVDEYYGFMWKWFEINEQVENITKTPPDLDLGCYREDGRIELIDRMRELGHVQLRKFSSTKK